MSDDDELEVASVDFDLEGEDATDALEEIDIDDAINAGKTALSGLEELLEDVESIDALESDEREAVRENFDALADIASVLTTFLETVDLGELTDAVDLEELLETIETGDIPEALRERDPSEAIDFGAVLDALELVGMWNASEFGDILDAGAELSDTIDDVGDDDSLVGSAVSAVTDDDGLMGDESGMDFEPEETFERMDVDVLEDPEYVQVAIQQGAMRGIDGVRDALLEAHEEFEDLYEWNRERMRRTDRGTNSRNPTAASTMPVGRADLGSDARYSTVPQQVRLSTAPSRRRIYGRRFEIERERKRRGER
ncbi:hypothetical protein [Natronosalvus vescus]|uniref:hypothetical protein n=1 Tax=Natronosalvus vescus TaxID=2953881 RepID=UPI002090E287|nr:hypothetical protein [Natronosalvus vescus]